MIVVRVLAIILGTIGVVGTLMPFLRYDDWWIRGFDYPRQQLIFILGLALIGWLVARPEAAVLQYGFTALLVLCISYQAYRIYPYTGLHSVVAKPATVLDKQDGHLSLLMTNVLQTNRKTELVLAEIERKQADIVLTVETNQWWEDRIAEGLGDDYPHRIRVPLENLYGMHLWSRIPLHNAEIKYRIKADIPSIDAQVDLPNGRRVQLHFIHPMPPSPTESYASTGRDAELALVGQEVRDRGPSTTTIVAGDLNDVAWSHSSRLFQRLSGLLDPRIGRGLYSTFHADYRIARWPLDHVFHSSDLTVVSLERLGHVGSDHFPVFIQLSYEPARDENQGETPEGDDLEEAERTISRAKKGETETVVDPDN